MLCSKVHRQRVFHLIIFSCKIAALPKALVRLVPGHQHGAHKTGQSRPDCGHRVQVKVLKTLQGIFFVARRIQVWIELLAELEEAFHQPWSHVPY